MIGKSNALAFHQKPGHEERELHYTCLCSNFRFVRLGELKRTKTRTAKVSISPLMCKNYLLVKMAI